MWQMHPETIFKRGGFAAISSRVLFTGFRAVLPLSSIADLVFANVPEHLELKGESPGFRRVVRPSDDSAGGGGGSTYVSRTWYDWLRLVVVG